MVRYALEAPFVTKKNNGSRAFKIETMCSREAYGRPVTELARELGIQPHNLVNRRRQLAGADQEACPGKGTLRALDDEPGRWRRENVWGPRNSRCASDRSRAQGPDSCAADRNAPPGEGHLRSRMMT